MKRAIAVLFGHVVRFRPQIIFRVESEGRVHKECKRINRSVPRVVCTVSAKSTERAILFSIKEGARGPLEEASHLDMVDGDPCQQTNSTSLASNWSRQK